MAEETMVFLQLDGSAGGRYYNFLHYVSSNDEWLAAEGREGAEGVDDYEGPHVHEVVVRY